MATPKTLEEYVSQKGYRNIGGRYYDVSGAEPSVVNPEDEFYSVKKRGDVEANVLKNLEKTAKGYRDPTTGLEYSAFKKGQMGSDTGAFDYDPYQGLMGFSTQGDTLYGPQATGVYSDAGQDYWLAPGYMNNSDFRVKAPIHEDTSFMTGIQPYLEFAGKAAAMYGGVNALANNLGPTLSNLTNTMPPAQLPASGAGGLTSGAANYGYEVSGEGVIPNDWREIAIELGAEVPTNLSGLSPDQMAEGLGSLGNIEQGAGQMFQNLPNPDWLNPTGVEASGLPTLSSGGSIIPGAGTVGANYLGTGAGYPTLATAGGAAGLTAAELASVGSNLTGPTQGAYQFPLDKAIGAGLGAIGNVVAAGDMADATRNAAAMADPFASERAFYQGKLRELYTNPEALMNNPLFSGARDQAMNATQRKLVSKGYSGSGNEALEMMKAGTNAQMQYAMPYLQQTGGFAGAGFGPGNSGSIAMQGAQNQAQNTQNMWGNLGYGLGSIFQGNQPTAAEKYTGTSGNQTLADLIRSF